MDDSNSLPERPLRFMLAAVGTRGDVQPMIALAQAISSRGHCAIVAAPPEFGDWVKSHGLDFVPIGHNFQQFLAAHPEVLTGNPMQAARAWSEGFAEGIPLHARHLRAASADVDAIAWGGLALAAPSVAEHLKIPAVGVLYSTSLVPSGMHPPPTMPWQALPRWLNRLLWLVNRGFSQRMVGPPLTVARAEMGLAPVRLYPHLIGQAHYVLATDETIFPSDPAWGSNYHRANYIFYDDPSMLDGQLQAWLQDGDPPVFVDFGSMSGEGTQRVAPMVVQALAAVGRRGLIGAGLAEHLGAVPSQWHVVRTAPHAKLFPLVAAVVHHGGSGTTANALRAGIPQVILPLLLDQYQHAHRLHLAGLAPRPVPMERITATQLGQAIDSALAAPSGPREEVARRLEASDGRGDIARHLETMVRQSASQRHARLELGAAQREERLDVAHVRVAGEQALR